MENLIKKIISIFINIFSGVAWILIDIFLITVFLWLSFSAMKAFQGNHMNREIIVTYVGGLALCFSLASVLFSYARVCGEDEKRKIASSGKAILNGGVILLLSFMLNCYQIVTIDQPITILQTLFNYCRLFAFAGSICFAFVAGLELHRGFKSLVGSIFT